MGRHHVQRNLDHDPAQLLVKPYQAIADAFLDELRPGTASSVSDGDVQGVPDGWLDTSAVRQRRDVWVAAGMANLVLGLRHEDALATLRASAVSRGQTLDAFAHDVVVGDVDLVTLDDRSSSDDDAEGARAAEPHRGKGSGADATTPAAVAPPTSERAPSTVQLLERIAQLEATVEQLQTALDHRPRIEHAVGMIMMLVPCGEELAIAALEEVSQNTNREVVDVADLITSSASRGRPLPADLVTALGDVLPPQTRRSRARLSPADD